MTEAKIVEIVSKLEVEKVRLEESLIPVVSSNVVSVGFVETKNLILVKYTGNVVYAYKYKPELDNTVLTTVDSVESKNESKNEKTISAFFKRLQESESKGKFINIHVKKLEFLKGIEAIVSFINEESIKESV